MRAVVQRVSEASVRIEGKELRETGAGLMILLGVAPGDEKPDADWLASKIAGMRIFEDAGGKMNLSLKSTGGSALIVSQFTLLASTRKGNRPSFDSAAPPPEAIPLYEYFVEMMDQDIPGIVRTGEFGASMQVSIVNEGPVTIVIDSRRRE